MEPKITTATSKDNPGVYVPPPLIYVAFFFLSFFFQRLWPFTIPGQQSLPVNVFGGILILLYGAVCFPAIWRFITSRNTLVTIRPARSLQTSGIYSVSRNPMYLSLLFLYTGIALFKGNGWTLIEIPILMITLQWYVIKPEEKYLKRKFNGEFEVYKKRVRRWI